MEENFPKKCPPYWPSVSQPKQENRDQSESQATI